MHAKEEHRQRCAATAIFGGGNNESKLNERGEREAVLCYASGRLTGDEEKESEREEEMVLSYDERLD